VQAFFVALSNFDTARFSMAANAFQAAQDIYDYAFGDTTRIAEVKTALASAVSSGLLTKGGTDNVTSASKNGVSYQKTVGLTESQRISAMQIAVRGLDNNTRPSTRTFARYF
jgi:transcriptional regulator GlxA family with amidase domain